MRRGVESSGVKLSTLLRQMQVERERFDPNSQACDIQDNVHMYLLIWTFSLVFRSNFTGCSFKTVAHLDFTKLN